MSDEEKEIYNLNDNVSQPDNTEESPLPAKATYTDSGDTKLHLSGMYRNWFLEYASYVILERAVPHLADGLKPVQRRILHAMKQLEDGRYNKVANVIGSTMAYHPHGDASIGDALVQMGQKDLLIDYQGNWGNVLTGDSAAAPRYIEARLSKFALEILLYKSKAGFFGLHIRKGSFHLKDYKAKNIRNVVFAGHASAGKTSLVEAAYYMTGKSDRLGTIAEGNTVSDFDAEEIRRKSSVSASIIP